MKKLITAAFAAATIVSAAGTVVFMATPAQAQINIHVGPQRHHHRHQVCSWRHHHRVCYWR